MSFIIKNIVVKNFRSIVYQEFDTQQLNIFVGANDSGKSNILRALNLFFNNKTDYNKDFKFEHDYSKFAPIVQKKAKEIVIALEIYPPSNYTLHNGAGYIVWQKKWRREGFWEDEIWDSNGNGLEKRSKIPAWLKSVKYRYVPAVKGDEFFAQLLSDLHDTLTFTSGHDFNDALNEFMKNVQTQTSLMQENLKANLGIESTISIPENLRALFSTLEFDTKIDNANSVYLSQRGDGIKTRHIPIIIDFMANIEKNEGGRGAIKVDTILGYEEPENNLELQKAFELANDFMVYSKSMQIFLTTHSPAFYNIETTHDGKDISTTYSVKRIGTDGTIVLKTEFDTIDNEMLMPMVASYIGNKYKEIEALQLELSKNTAIIESYNTPVLFVEGESDKLILKKAIEFFSTNETVKNSLRIEYDNGCSYIKDMMIAYLYDRNKIYKCACLLDLDEKGKKTKNEIISQSKYIASKEAKKIEIFDLNGTAINNHLRTILSKTPLPYMIEDLFDIAVIRHAESHNWLKEKPNLDKSQVPSEKSYKDYLIQDKKLSEDEFLYTKTIKMENKKDFSDHVTKNATAEMYVNFKPLIAKLDAFYT